MDEINKKGALNIPGLKPETARRLCESLECGIISDAKVAGLLTDAENKYKRKKKQEAKRAINSSKISKLSPFISREQSAKFWGEENTAPNQELADYLFSPAPMSPTNEIKTTMVWLNGFSFERLFKLFPDRIILKNPKRYAWYRETSSAGYYLISINNFFLNYSVAAEEHNMPRNYWRLEGNLLLELLFVMESLSVKMPDYFMRTLFKNRHDKYFCIGYRDGTMVFKPFNGGKKQEDIIPALKKIN